MFETGHHISFLVFLVGALISLSLWLKAIFHKRNLPPLIGYVLLGWMLRTADNMWGLLPETSPAILHFLSDIGIIVLLFRIGFQSHINALIAQLSRASLLAISNILLSGILGFYVSYSFLSITLIPSLFVAVALTATSIGITVSIWKENKILNTDAGNLLLDLVALDDVIAIVLMGILFNLAPLISEAESLSLSSSMAVPALIIIGKLFLFVLLCYLFSHFLESDLTQYLRRYEPKPDLMVSVAGMGFMIAGLAAFLGFSVALGAFFAGIAFSRDKVAKKMASSFQPLEDFFIPFFFIGIGYKTSPIAFTLVFGTFAVLFICAVLGKTLGIYLPARAIGMSRFNAMLLGVSMIPRAEVAMITMDHGLGLGDWAVSQNIYTVMVLVSLLTSLSTPLLLKPLLKLKTPSKNSTNP